MTSYALHSMFKYWEQAFYIKKARSIRFGLSLYRNPYVSCLVRRGKARWEGFCMGVGLVGALCGTELCAGKRVWLALAGLHGTPPRFPSCHSLQFHPPCFPSYAPLHPCSPLSPCFLSALHFYPYFRGTSVVV